MSGNALPTVLEEIVAQRRTHLPALRERLSHVDLASVPRSERSLADALRGTNRFIMECKSASPSLGMIREDYRPGDIARIYSRYASAISVLCEPNRFGGDYDHLQTVALSTHVPVLCKDFIVDPIQVYAARYYGADAILLMMSIVDDDTYGELKALADELGLDVLTEAITEDEVDRAVNFGVDIIGINNRNLHDLSIDLGRTERLARHVPDGKAIVSESGICDNATVRRLGAHAHAFLVGSQLTSQEDIDRAARDLVYGANKVCGLTTASSAQSARAAGARYGGLIFAPDSPRSVSRETAQSIISAEPELEYVAVTRSTDVEMLRSIAQIPGLKVLQLHAPFQGSREAELQFLHDVRGVADGLNLWRAIDMNNSEFAALTPDLVPEVEALVLDSGSGGTGTTFEWRTIPDEVKEKSLLAGGLRLDNLEEALSIGTAGLDLNSGLEYAPGRKDSSLIAQAFSTIRNYTHTHRKKRTMTVSRETLLPAYFGEFGGQFVPESLIPALDQLEKAFVEAQNDPVFRKELSALLRDYLGRPTPITEARNLGGKARIFLKREDLVHGGAHKTNQVLGQALLAKRMGKTRIIAETGAGQHGTATALACALLDLECVIYMGAKDVARQQPNVFRMELMGAKVVAVDTGSGTLKDAVNEALRDWTATFHESHYLLGTAAGPHPFPTIVREFHKVISEEAKAQMLERTGGLPDVVVACVGGGSNAIGMFADFIEEEEVELVGAEPGGEGLDSGKHGATINNGTVGILHGARSYLMRNADGQVEESYSISAGLDYPGVGPQHAHLHASGRAQNVGITDVEALEAFQLLSTKEGIIPALESSHALAYALKRKDEDINILVSLSGRGDKDIDHVRHTLENHPEFKLQEKN